MNETTHENRAIARFSNLTESNIHLGLEPEGHHFTLRPGMRIVVMAVNSPDGRLEIDLEPQRISVWGWEDSTLDIYHDGTKMMTDQGYIP